MADTPNAKPAAPSEDMDKWAADQLAALEAKTTAPVPARPAPAPAPAAPAAGGVRPWHLFVAAALAVAPALCLLVFLLARHEAPAGAAEVRLSLERLEKKLVAMQAADQLPTRPARGAEPTDTYLSLLSQANLQFRDGNYLGAMDHYRAAIVADTAESLSDEAHYRLGLCLLKEGKPDEAADELRQVVNRFPGSSFYARASVELAQVLMAQRSYATARRALFQVIAVRDRLQGDEREALERAYFAVAHCYEGEADAAVATRTPAAMAFGMKAASDEVKK